MFVRRFGFKRLQKENGRQEVNTNYSKPAQVSSAGSCWARIRSVLQALAITAVLGFAGTASAQPVVALSGTQVNGGNGNGLFDADECNTFVINLGNNGNQTATAVSANLVS